MLHLIPRDLHRAAYRLAHRCRAIWWRIINPTIIGCRVLAMDDAGRLLLVRPTYGKQLWQFPGGGVGTGEDPEVAARREFGEETGLTLSELKRVGYTLIDLHGAENKVWVFVGKSDGQPRIDHREIAEAAWFRRNALPENRSMTVDEELLAHSEDLEQLKER